MRGATHIIFGACLGYATSYLMPSPHAPLVVATASAAGALLPDVDHPGSSFGRRIKPISLLISAIFGHRGITHSLLAAMALGLLLFFKVELMPDWALGLVIGYLSHLIGDWMTPSGVPLLWPSREKFCAPYVFRTGGIDEAMFMVAMLVVLGLLLWK